MSKVKLSDIANIQAGPFGTQLHMSEYVSSGILMLNAKNIGQGEIVTDSVDYVSEEVCKRLPNYVLKEGDILFGRAGTIDRHTYVEKEYEGCFQGTNCIRIRCLDIEVAKYISYYLWVESVKKSIENKTSGSILSYITTDLLANLEVELPEKEKIKSVISILGLLDKKIKNNKTINNNLQVYFSMVA